MASLFDAAYRAQLWAHFVVNFKAAFTHISTYIAFFSTAAAAWWLQQDAATQAQVLAAFPAVKLIGPGVSIVMFLIAKGLPQAEQLIPGNMPPPPAPPEVSAPPPAPSDPPNPPVSPIK